MNRYALTPLAKADRPLLGHTRRDLTTRPVRFWTLVHYPNYRIVYRTDTKPLRVIAVLHGPEKRRPDSEKSRMTGKRHETIEANRRIA